MPVFTYDPNEAVLSVGGVPLSGFTDGSFIKVSRDEDAYTKAVGADGQVSRAKSANRSGSITITLKQTSVSNDVLSGFAQADEVGNAGLVPVLIKDLLGTTLVSSAGTWIKKMADVDMGKELSDREWVLDCESINLVVGGNSTS